MLREMTSNYKLKWHNIDQYLTLYKYLFVIYFITLRRECPTPVMN